LNETVLNILNNIRTKNIGKSFSQPFLSGIKRGTGLGVGPQFWVVGFKINQESTGVSSIYLDENRTQEDIQNPGYLIQFTDNGYNPYTVSDKDNNQFYNFDHKFFVPVVFSPRKAVSELTQKLIKYSTSNTNSSTSTDGS